MRLRRPGEFLIGGGGESMDKVRTYKALSYRINEVTRGQFAAFVDDVGYQTEAEKPWGSGVSDSGGEYPSAGPYSAPATPDFRRMIIIRSVCVTGMLPWPMQNG